MKAAFVTNWKFMPRATRKALRVVTPKREDNTRHTDLTETFRRGAYCIDAYHNQNLFVSDRQDDEFNDIDDELDGLTIVEPMSEEELFRFCTGYDIL